MNIENINKAITVMERAKLHDSIDMKFWQAIPMSDGSVVPVENIHEHTVAKTEEELHACGNKACFAGYLSVSPEWLSTPGFGVTSSGRPRYISYGFDHQGIEAVAIFLGISSDLSLHFVTSDKPWSMNQLPHLLYKVLWKDVKADDVIRELTLLRDLGEDAYMKAVLSTKTE